MICLDGESLAAGGHYEIEPDEDQPAHRLVSAPQLGNVAGAVSAGHCKIGAPSLTS
jgi:hypothetical protein